MTPDTPLDNVIGSVVQDDGAAAISEGFCPACNGPLLVLSDALAKATEHFYAKPHAYCLPCDGVVGWYPEGSQGVWYLGYGRKSEGWKKLMFG